MARPDPLRALRLLRRLELENARRGFAEKIRAEARAAEGLDRAVQELAVEAVGAAASDYAAWLPAAQSRMEQAAALHVATDAELAVAQVAVAIAARGEQVTLQEMTRRDREYRATRLVKAHRLLDDLGSRPLKPPLGPVIK